MGWKADRVAAEAKRLRYNFARRASIAAQADRKVQQILLIFSRTR